MQVDVSRVYELVQVNVHLQEHDLVSKIIPIAHVVAVQVLVVPPEQAHVDAFWVYPG